MIKDIGGGAFIDVEGNTSSMPYITTDPDNPSQGMVRIKGSDIQVWDRDNWIQVGTNYATVSLNSSAQSAISWAMKKMAEEAELEKLSESHPAVRIAYENMQRAAKQLKTTIILSKDE